MAKNAKIKHISVKVTYRVGFEGLEAPKNIVEQLKKISNGGLEIQLGDIKYPDVSDWIHENIKERDCFESVYEIEEIE
jgi:hypothetical protein